MEIAFTKAVATGNDFVIVDGRRRLGRIALPELARIVCARKKSVGADGLLVIERSEACDIRMRIFNPDGSEAEMCGNGSRCAALYAATKAIARRSMTVETIAGRLRATVKGATVKVRMTDPSGMRCGVDLGAVGGCVRVVDAINTGVPHAVCFVNDLADVDVCGVGKLIRHHERFAPAGTNVDFVRKTGKTSIEVRTYERGVEDETLACGTGSVASAILAAARFGMDSPVDVMTASGEKLKIYFAREGETIGDVYLEGVASLVFEGTVNIRKRG